MKRYFPETTDEDLDFVRNSFTYPVEKLTDDSQDEFSELINDSSARQKHEEKLLSQFWVAMKNSYPKTMEKALHVLILFSRFICASLDFLLCCKLKANNEIDLMLKMTYDVHPLRLHLVFGCFPIGN